MFRSYLSVLSVGLGMVASSAADVDLLARSFPDIHIPDGEPSGLTLSLGQAPGLTSLNSVTVTLAHEWLGDLTLKLISPTGSEFTLLDRPDVTSAKPEGSSAVLGSFVFDTTGQGVLTPQPYRFAESGSDLLAAARNAVQTQAAPILPTDLAYASQSWNVGPFPAGEWHLYLSDSEELSHGILSGVQMSYAPVPTPEPRVLALGAIAAGALLAVRRLHRRGTRSGRP